MNKFDNREQQTEHYHFSSEFSEGNAISEMIKQIRPGSVVLVFGPAFRTAAKYLSESLQCELHTVEPYEDAHQTTTANDNDSFGKDLAEGRWYQKYQNMQFDYVVLADVLGRLANPPIFLEKAKGLLKEDGRLLLSVPNIAYGGVIAGLLNGQFQERAVGLLDNTHVKFFTYFSLVSMLTKAGYETEWELPLYLPMEQSEFAAESENLPLQVAEYLETQPGFEVYEYVVSCVKKEYAQAQGDGFQRQLYAPSVPVERMDTGLYLDTGAGFSEAQRISSSCFLKQDGQFSIAYRLDESEEVKGLSWHPAEGSYCACSLEAFECDGKPLPVSAANLVCSTDSFDLFLTTDPKYEYFQNLGSIRQIVIKGRFHRLPLLGKYDPFYHVILQRMQDSLEQERYQQTCLENLQRENRSLTLSKNQLVEKNKQLIEQVQILTGQYEGVVGSTSWKITKPVRVVLDFFKRLPILRLVYKTLATLKRSGLRVTLKKIRFKLSAEKGKRKIKRSHSNATLNPVSEKEKQRQREAVFSVPLKFSILVPLYNTPIVFLKEMIQSVLDQTYGDWELCLADGSDEAHDEVGRVCRELAQKDPRIRYQKLKKNLGISENTNRCIEMATGDYIALFDHDDILHPSALYENRRVIEEQGADFIYTDENTFSEKIQDAYTPHFKPDYAPDTLRSNNYICHFSVFSRKLLDKVGGFRKEFDGSQDYDIILRLTEQAQKIVHIPKILYFWRAHKNSVASNIAAKPYTLVAAKKALTEHLQRVGLKGEVLDSKVPSTYRIQYEIADHPLISILIPNKDHWKDLKKCLDSIFQLSTYQNFEIIIIENNSTDLETFSYYKQLKEYDCVQIVEWKGPFNYSAINNFGATFAHGQYLLLLNNDVEIITPDWLEQMLMFAQRADVGAVGVKLYYPDDTVQHAGIGLGLLTLAGHYHKGFLREHPGYMGRLSFAQNMTAVTAACMMVRREVFDEIDGFDESFAVAFNDVDLCMRIRQKGYLIVFTPYAELYHYESKSRGIDDTVEKRKRFEGEVTRFQTRWKKELEAGDPYYNPNLSLDSEDFAIR